MSKNAEETYIQLTKHQCRYIISDFNGLIAMFTLEMEAMRRQIRVKAKDRKEYLLPKRKKEDLGEKGRKAVYQGTQEVRRTRKQSAQDQTEI
jgi:hypothetical protein